MKTGNTAALLFSLMMICSVCSADDSAGQLEAEKQGKFSVRSEHRSFNPFNLSYTLKGNVVARFPNRNGFVVIRADKAVAKFVSQKIVATGNVQLNFNETFISCDSSTIFNKQKQAYLYGNVYFKKGNDVITAPEAKYNWRERLANFMNAKRNGASVLGTIVMEI